MKNVYFVQVDVSAALGSKNAYLPYTGGILMASAFRDKVVSDNLCFKEFIFLREDIKSVTDRLDNPFIVAFSNYCWNTEYNKELAKAVKEKYPSCYTVFGGHNVPPDTSFLEEFAYIDILQHGEGEDGTGLLFRALATDGDLSQVPNISFRNANGYVSTEFRCQKTLNYPSPYLEGWFDDVIEKHPEITFNAILETSRGCPNSCAYCDWGLLKSKVRLFPFDRIRAEIKWMSEHKIAFVWGADANFGLFDRDIDIAKELANAKKTTGYPEKMRMNYAKNKPENVFEIVKIFKECDFDRIGATLSFQSMSQEVLKNIGRKNSDIDFYKNLLTKYNKENMKTYSELILGLPGETYESFIKGIGTLFEIGQHFVFDVYSCILLPNAVMGSRDYVEKHGLNTVRAEILRPHFSGEDFSVPEYNNIVTETKTMSRDMWVRSTVFYYLAKAFHGNGLLRAFAIYLYSQKGIAYEVFYDRLLTFLEENPDTVAGSIIAEITDHARELSLGKNNRKLIFEPAGSAIWDDHEYAVMKILADKDRFYNELLPFLKEFDIPDDMFESLWNYQTAVMRRPCEEQTETVMYYDIHKFLTDAYVNNIHAPEQKKHKLILKDSDVMSNWVDFGKYVIWYGRMGWASYKNEIIYTDF